MATVNAIAAAPDLILFHSNSNQFGFYREFFVTNSRTSNRPLKRFSQNFLTNVHYQQKIVENLHITADDIVLEIGPGKGALSTHIIDARPARFIAVEVDERWVEELRKKFAGQVEVLHRDFLTIALADLAEGRRLKVIGNVPYHITSPILFHLLDFYQSIERAVLMVQKEVAKRITARPGSKDYGILSVLTQAYAHAEYLFEIKRGNFFPVPGVDSAVIALDFFPRIENVPDEALFRKVVRGAFNFRRKTLKNSLSRIFDKASVNSLNENLLARRPEQLTVEEFKQLTNSLKQEKGL